MTDDLTQAEIFYSDDAPVVATYEPSIGESINQLRDRTGMNEADSAKLLTETSQFFHGANIPPGQAVNLHSLIVKHLQEPASNELESEWATESRRQLREKWGDDADRRMEKVKEFVNSHPTLAKQLNDSGVGSHPEFMRALVERANNLRPRRK
ncbi:MAG: hypothetical protein M3Z54_07650 [Gemmatimonadota bacterium]|nr:hypothetical protein [Gemmatimonadota bacterium]